MIVTFKIICNLFFLSFLKDIISKISSLLVTRCATFAVKCFEEFK